MADGSSYVKAGLTAVTPFLSVPDVPVASALYVQLFEAVEERRDPGSDGVIQHAVLRIAGAPFELGRHGHAAHPPAPGGLPPVGMHLYVPDVDAVWARASAVGATGHAPTDQPHGDREAMIVDPFGITWYVATNQA
jgi:PhnB protein